MKTLPYSLFGALLIIIIWFLATWLNWLPDTLLASPNEVIIELLGILGLAEPSVKEIEVHFINTVGRAMQGWLYGSIIGVTIGIALGVSKEIFSMFAGVVEFIRAIPPILIFPVMLVAFNYGELSYTYTIVFGTLPIIVLTVSRGVAQIEIARLQLMKVFGVSRAKRMIAFTLEFLPNLFLGMRLAFSMSLIVAIVTEMVFTPRNGYALGALARDSEIEFNTPAFYTCLLLIGVFGYTGNLILRELENYFKPS